CAVEMGVGDLPRRPDGPRHGLARPLPAAPKSSRPGREHSEYSRGEPDGDTVTIQKRYEMKVDAAGANPALNLTFEGSITFDVKAGLPRAIDFKGAYTDGVRRWPITVTYRLLEGEARDRVLNPPKEEPKPVADADVVEALAGLQGPGRRTALDQLTRAVPNA